MRQRGYLILLALGVAFLIVVNLPATVALPLRTVVREGLSPFQGWVARLLNRADHVVSSVSDFDRLRAESIEGVGAKAAQLRDDEATALFHRRFPVPVPA